MIRRVLVGTGFGGVAVTMVLAGLWQFDGFQRWLVEIFDRTPSFPAAQAADSLTPEFTGADRARPQLQVVLTPVIEGVEQPTDVQFVPGQAQLAIVLGKGGTAWRAPLSGVVQPWFDVDVATTSELGLLGLAFHPAFTDNGLFFVHYTVTGKGRKATSRIARWRTDPATLAAPMEVSVVLELEQPFQNHDGGQIRFGSDGMLYIAFGDGGSRDDPHGNGQDRSTWLGSILRVDIDVEGAPYRVPPDNPFASQAGLRPEIWAWGLRNPWRFDTLPDGRLVVADVGQNRWEEISVVARGDNLGWKIREADHCFEPKSGCPSDGLVDPIWSYDRDDGQSVTGGVVATAGPLAGRYVFGDFVTGRLWALTVPDSLVRVQDVHALGRWDVMPSAFGRDASGQVYLADFGRGAVFRIDAADTPPVAP